MKLRTARWRRAVSAVSDGILSGIPFVDMHGDGIAREMTCPKGHIVPGQNVACPICVRDRAEIALLELQAVLLRKVSQNSMGCLLLITKTREHHVLMYTLTWPDLRTFCGAALRTKPQIKAQPYYDLDLVCAECRKVIEGLVAAKTTVP